MQCERKPIAGIEPMLSIGEIAQLLGCSKRSLERMRASGELPPPDFVRPKLLRWKRSTVEGWIAANAN